MVCYGFKVVQDLVHPQKGMCQSGGTAKSWLSGVHLFSLQIGLRSIGLKPHTHAKREGVLGANPSCTSRFVLPHVFATFICGVEWENPPSPFLLKVRESRARCQTLPRDSLLSIAEVDDRCPRDLEDYRVTKGSVH